MSSFTPGPWELNGGIDDAGEEAGCQFIIGHALGGLIGAAMAWPTELDSRDFSRVEANARLIAAAPDLLEALKAVNALISEAAQTGFNYKTGDWAERLFASQWNTSEAIRKAEGRELKPLANIYDTGAAQ